MDNIISPTVQMGKRRYRGAKNLLKVTQPMRDRAGIQMSTRVFALHLWILGRALAFHEMASGLGLASNEEASKGCPTVLALKLLTLCKERQAWAEAFRVYTGTDRDACRSRPLLQNEGQLDDD